MTRESKINSLDSSLQSQLEQVEFGRRALYKMFHDYVADQSIKQRQDPDVRMAVRDAIISEITDLSKQRWQLKKAIGRTAAKN